MQNLRFVSSSIPEILGGSQNLKAGHVTLATLPCDLIFFYFCTSTSWSPVEFQISTWSGVLFWRHCHCKILAFWQENAYSFQFLTVLGDFNPLKLWCRCSNPQRNAIFPETRVLRHYRQNRSSGLTPSWADEQTEKAQIINILFLCGGHPLNLNRSTCYLQYWVAFST